MVKDKDPQTIFKRLEAGTGLTPAVNSRSATSFNWTRNGEVGFDRNAGQSWRQFGAIFADFDSGIRTLMRTETEKRIMEDANDANVFQTENPDLTANMKAWAEASEKNEGIRNMSPYVKNAVVRGVLRNTAIQAGAELDDWYVTSGEVNNTNTGDVHKKLREKSKEISQQLGVKEQPGHWDAIDIGENYTLPVNGAVARIMAKHSRDIEAQNSEKIRQQYYKDFYDLTLNRMTSLNGNLNPHIPREEGLLATESITWLNNEAARIKSLGFKETDVLAMQGEAVMKSALPASTKRVLTEQLHATVNGKQVPLISQPGITKMLDDFEEQEGDKRWKQISRARAQEAWGREDMQRAASRAGYAAVMEHKGEAFDLTQEFNKLGIDPIHFVSFQQAVTHAQTSVATSPENLINFSRLQLGIRTGKIGRGDTEEYIRNNTLTPQQAIDILDMQTNSKTEEENIVTVLNSAASEYLSFTMNVSKEQTEALLNAWQSGGKVPTIPGAIEALEGLNPYLEGLQNEINLKKAEKEGGDRALREAELLKIRREYASATLPKVNTAAQTKAHTEKDEKANKTAMATFVSDAGKMPTSWFEEDTKANFRHRVAYDMRQNLINMFPEIQEDSDWKSIQRSSDPMDYLQIMVDHGGLSNANIVRLFEGKYPEELGLNSTQQIIDFLTERLVRAGYQPQKKKVNLSSDTPSPKRKEEGGD